ncbi:MAG: hypothetical protein NTU81_00210 [Candidatus Nomurabacteria bacterium]|nr:hypothetical protein [Candidatus Nomurabacteria bacterium]
MKKRHNKFLIISTIILVSGGVYLYSSGNSSKDSIVPVAFGASLVSSTGAGSPDVNPALAGDTGSDIAFLNTLVSLKKIKLGVDLFSTDSFKSLKNNSVKIESVKPGRMNPFAPISAAEVVVVGTTPMVATDQPTDITDKTVVLNGTVNATTAVTDTYFEYSSSLLPATTIVAISKLSLVGTFVKTIVGLTPKTTYSFKACAKINNIANCGEVVSFTTK